MWWGLDVRFNGLLSTEDVWYSTLYFCFQECCVVSNVRNCCYRVLDFSTDKAMRCALCYEDRLVQSLSTLEMRALPPVLPHTFLWGSWWQGRSYCWESTESEWFLATFLGQVWEQRMLCTILTYYYSHQVLSVNAQRVSTLYFLLIQNCLNWYA